MTTRRSVIRHFIALALVLAAPLAARADLLSYTITGTVTDPVGATSPTGGTAASPVATGDHLTWTVRYDTSAPAGPTSDPSSRLYAQSSPIISNIVDQTNGFHFTAPPATSLQSYLSLANLNASYRSSLSIMDWQSGPNNTALYQASLGLVRFSSVFPSLDLTQFRLDQAGFDITGPAGAFSNLYYYGIPDPASGAQLSFTAEVTSISAGATVATPEPGTLMLFVLGILGLAAHRVRRRISCPAPLV